MVIIERDKSGLVTLRGRLPDDWMVLPYWPMSPSKIKKIAPGRASLDWVKECQEMAFDEISGANQ